MLEKDFKAHITFIWTLFVGISFSMDFFSIDKKLFRYKCAKFIIQIKVVLFLVRNKV